MTALELILGPMLALVVEPLIVHSKALILALVAAYFWSVGWLYFIGGIYEVSRPGWLGRTLLGCAKVLAGWIGATAYVLMISHAVYGIALNLRDVALVCGVVMTVIFFASLFVSPARRVVATPKAPEGLRRPSGAFWWFAVPAAVTVFFLTRK